jgi:hypothetical protein
LTESDADRQRREQAEVEEYERQRRLKEDERRRREEEAWLKEQQALEELNRKQAQPYICYFVALMCATRLEMFLPQ